MGWCIFTYSVEIVSVSKILIPPLPSSLHNGFLEDEELGQTF